jgi:uncharacterized membrane-anchored protein
MIQLCIALIVAVASMAGDATARPYSEMFPGRTYENEKAQTFVEGLDYQQGAIPLGAGGVQLQVPQDFYYISREHSQQIITEIWGNPPVTAQNVLGMIFPSEHTPVDETWGAVITFDNDGYVSDEDAASIDYTKLLKEMQEATAGGNEERIKQGFGSLRLVGWASPPFYDKATHKLHWAKELEFGGQSVHTLNYDVRALGRSGVLKINFVSEMNKLAEITKVIPAVMAMPGFEQGSRYQDYIPGTDKVAAYGLGGLIAGKVLSKAGLLALALVFLKKGWIVVVLALAGLWKLVARLFRGNPQT